MRASRSVKRLITIPKKFFAGGGAVKKIDPNLKDFDVIFVGGLNSSLILKTFQQKHFHGTMAAFNHSSKFNYEHLYDYVIAGNMKSFKYSAMPFTSLVDLAQSRVMKDTVTQINPAKNQVTTSRGEVFNYKTLVLNTGLNQKSEGDPILAPYLNDGDYGKTRVFVHEPSSGYHLSRNSRIFHMHKDGDFIVYLTGGPNKRESYEHWYLMLDTYLARSQSVGSHSQSMRIKVITPHNYLFKFPFANEVVMEEISNRSMIDVHFGMELVGIDVKQTVNGLSRLATFKDLKSGQNVTMNFGTFLTTPKSRKRELYNNNDIADEDGQVLVNPYSLQHLKYPNIFAFGDCAKLPTTKGTYASLNQSVVVRNNLWDYLHGNEMKAVYEGYSNFSVFHAIDRIWIFKQNYNYEPAFTNFYVPRALGFFAFKLKSSLERQYLGRIYSKKPNAGYPYVQKEKFFRPLAENRFMKKHNLTVKDIFPHEYHKPSLSCDHHHEEAHPAPSH